MHHVGNGTFGLLIPPNVAVPERETKAAGALAAFVWVILDVVAVVAAR